MLNVLFISNSYPTLTHPTKQIFVKNMLEEMNKQNVHTELIFNPVFKRSKKFTSGKNVFTKTIKSLSLISSIFFNFRKLLRADVIFSHAILFPTFYATILKPIHRKPIVCYVHGGDLNTFSRTKGILRRFLVYALNKSDFIICNSSDIQNKVKDLNISDKKVKVIPPGVDLSKMLNLKERNKHKRTHELTNKFVALTIGNAVKRKGHLHLLEGVKYLKENTNIPIFLILISEGKQIDNYKKFIEEHDLEDVVSIQNFLPQQKLVEFYNTADLFIFPSLEEPLGLVAIEAMACGLPVIGSNVGGIRSILSNNAGFLYESENVKDLCNKVERVYNKGYDKNEMEKAMKLKVHEYALENNVKEMIDILSQQSIKGNK